MRKSSLIFFLLAVIILAGAGCYGTSPAPAPQTGTPVINSNTEYFPPTNTNIETPPANTNVSVPTPANVNQPVPTTVTVDIKNFAFDPANLTVSVGTTVKWENYDSVPHQIAGEGFGSGSLGQGGDYFFTFNQAGTYNYHCAIHPSMTGTITVQ